MLELKTKNANSIFEQPWWLNIVAKDSWHDITVKIDDEVVARLPIYTKNKWYGTFITMPVHTQTLGAWVKQIENKEGNNHLSFQKDVINKLIDQIPNNAFTKITLHSSNKYVLPYIWRGFRVKPTFSYQITNLTDHEAIYNSFHKTVKKNIKSANKKVIITTDTDAERLTRILEITFRAQGRKYPISFDIIRKIIDDCNNRHSGIMFSAIDKEGNVHSCSYFIYDENTFYYLISGSDPQYRTSGAQTLVLWEAIKYASTVSNTFDFEGSNIEGIEKFFRQFGGTPIVNYEIRKLPLVFEILEILKPKIKKLLNYK